MTNRLLPQLSADPEVQRIFNQLVAALTAAAARHDAQLNSLRIVYISETEDARHVMGQGWGCACDSCREDAIRQLRKGDARPDQPRDFRNVN